MKIIAQGFNAFETDKAPIGTVKYLSDPTAVIALIQSGNLKDYIILTQGGTTTFLAPALSMGTIGVVTMSGAPESHLGILSREFQIPCVMTVSLASSESRYVAGADNATHFAEVVRTLDGKRVQLSCQDPKIGQVMLIG